MVYINISFFFNACFGMFIFSHFYLYVRTCCNIKWSYLIKWITVCNNLLTLLTVHFMKDEAPQLVNPLVESFVARHAKSSSLTPSVDWFPVSHFIDAAGHIEIAYISSFASTNNGFFLLYSIYIMNFLSIERFTLEGKVRK